VPSICRQLEGLERTLYVTTPMNSCFTTTYLTTAIACCKRRSTALLVRHRSLLFRQLSLAQPLLWPVRLISRRHLLTWSFRRDSLVNGGFNHAL
jgi:hypothetical protein